VIRLDHEDPLDGSVICSWEGELEILGQGAAGGASE